ncbi:RED-like protein N-terminal region-domain-containing protein [Gaertneriomyces semiglobifer]|nr:RED-like protein N-terminal region-domain-containing protein [Gaertneriomyces semiglobifer]
MSGTNGLSQDDFRKLLMTPRPSSGSTSTIETPRKRPPPTPRGGSSSGGTSQSTKDSDGFMVPTTLSRPKTKKLWKPPSSSDNRDQTNPTSSSYRDRAKERREGANPDYAHGEQMLEVLKQSLEQHGAAGPGGPLLSSTDVDPATLSYEQSKYLGGDAEHTHLVKGLDYALLEKTRNEIQKQELELQKEKEAQAYVEQMHGDGATAKFNSILAANIYDIVVKKAKIEYPKRNEMFVPGRMVFHWDLSAWTADGEPISTSDIPTTVIRSKAELRPTDLGFVSSNDLVIDKITAVMAGLRDGSRGHRGGTKSMKKKSKHHSETDHEGRQQEDINVPVQTQPAPASIDDDDDDIFGDAGRDYELNVPERKADHVAPAIKPHLFDASLDEPPEAMDVDVSLPAGTISSIVQQGTGGLDSLEGNTVVQDLGYALEAAPKAPAFGERVAVEPNVPNKRRISETQEPAADDFDADLADLDDSAPSDASGAANIQPDRSDNIHRKQRVMTRLDFDTDEDWQRHKKSYAAFQYDLEPEEKSGKAGKRGNPGKKSHDAKLNRDFQQLNKVYSAKYGETLGDGKQGKKKKQKR